MSSRALGLGRNRFGDAVGGEDHRRVARRRLVQLFDENRAFGLQRSTTYLLCTIS